MKNEVIEILTQYLTEERLSKIIAQNEEYNTALVTEIEVHDKFEKTLSDEQKELFNEFISASSDTEAQIEKLNYQQGMKDLFSLLKALS